MRVFYHTIAEKQGFASPCHIIWQDIRNECISSHNALNSTYKVGMVMYFK